MPWNYDGERWVELFCEPSEGVTQGEMMDIEERIGILEAGAKSRIAWLKELDQCVKALRQEHQSRMDELGQDIYERRVATNANSCQLGDHAQRIWRLEEDVKTLRAQVSQLEGGEGREWWTFRVGEYALDYSSRSGPRIIRGGCVEYSVVAEWNGMDFHLMCPSDADFNARYDIDFWEVVREGFRRLYPE